MKLPSRGKLWIHPDGSSEPREPTVGSIFLWDDPPTLEVYGPGEQYGQAVLSDEQLEALREVFGQRNC